MTNSLHVIEQRQLLGQDFKMYGTFEEPLFLAKDVAEWIDYSKTGKGQYDVSRMMGVVDEDEKLVRTIFVSGQNRDVWFLTENGLYEVLMQSRKPIAKQFKSEVKKLLKSLRTGRVTISLPQDYPSALRALADSEEQKLLQLEENTVQKQIIGELQPKASYYDTVLENKSLVGINQIAKDYGMSGQRMNKLLHKLGIQYKQGDQWLLYSKYHSQGYTHSKTTTITHTNGTTSVKLLTKWTQKGRLFLYEQLKAANILPVIERGKAS